MLDTYACDVLIGRSGLGPGRVYVVFIAFRTGFGNGFYSRVRSRTQAVKIIFLVT